MDPLIETENIWFRYEEEWVLRGVSLKANRGEFLGILGRNGSGKTTLVKHFNGLLKPEKGRVLVEGKDTKEKHPSELSDQVGYVFQNPKHQIFSTKVKEEIEFGPSNVGVENLEEVTEEALKTVGLEDKMGSTTFSLSKGEKQRLALASLIAMDPEVLIIDEPTTGQDYETCKRIMELARDFCREGKAIVMISHDLNLITRWSDRVVLLEDGEVKKRGRPTKILSKGKEIERLGLEVPETLKIKQELGLENLHRRIGEG